MEKGEIIESGSHDQLVAKGETYARLLQAQFERPAGISESASSIV